jgi:hypothetical protein
MQSPSSEKPLSPAGPGRQALDLPTVESLISQGVATIPTLLWRC